MSYVVRLHFSSGDKCYAVLSDGFSLPDDVGAKGRHVTQSCSLKIHSAEASMLFLQETALFVNAELCERSGNTDTVIFDGVIRPYQSVSAKNNTEDKFSLQIMDFTEVMKVRRFEDEYYELKSLGWLVSHVYGLAELSPVLSYPAEMDNINLAYKLLDSDKYANVADLFSAILFEFGYDYKFTPSGCTVFRTWLEDGTGLPVASIKNRLRVQRDDNWTDGVKVNYGITGIIRHLKIGEWTEDVSDPQWWRYTLPWSYSTSSGQLTRTIAYEPDFYGRSKEKPEGFKAEYILHALNVSAEDSSTPRSCQIVNVAPKAHSVEVTFSWDVFLNYVWGCVTSGVPRFSVYGDVIYALPGDYQEKISGEKPDEFTLSFVTEADLAKAFAEREYKRAKVAPITYSFQSLTHYAAGSFVRITETVIGIDVCARILSCSRDANGIYTVKAESADYLGMSVTIQDLRNRDIIESANDLTLEASASGIVENESVTLTAKGTILDILDTEGSTGYSFVWQLNGAEKASWSGLKTVTVTAEDLEAGENAFTFKVMYGTNLVGSAAISVNKSVGVAIMSTIEQYYISESATSLIGGEWLDTLVAYTSGYLWRRLKYSHSDGTVNYGEPLCVEMPDASGTTYEIEYGISDSADHYSWAFADLGDSEDVLAFGPGSDTISFTNREEWSDTYDDWYRGLYVWQRVKITDAQGIVTYSEPTYCEEITKGLEQSCVFDVIPASGAWEKDMASTGNVTVLFSLKMTGFPSVAAAASKVTAISIQPYKNGSAVGSAIAITVSSTSLNYSFTFQKASDWDSFVITAAMRVDQNHDTETATATVVANDVTNYVQFVGVITTNTLPAARLDGGRLVKGDYFVAGVDINADGIGSSTVYDATGTQITSIPKGSPLQYLGLSAWEIIGEMTDYNIAMGCLGGILDAGIELNSIYYTWVKNLVGQNAVLDNLIVRMLTVGLGNETTGFYVKIAEERDSSNNKVYTFVVKFNGTEVFSIDPVSGNVKMINANVTGDFTSEGFATQNASETHSINASCTSANKYDLYDFHCAAVGSLVAHSTYRQTSASAYSRTFYSNTSGYCKGTAFSKIGVLGDPRLTYLPNYSSSSPFGSGLNKFSQVWLVSGNDGTCLVYVDNYWGSGDVSANVKSVAGIIFESGATAVYSATRLNEQEYIAISSASSVVYSGTTAWSSASNADIFYYDTTTVSMDSSYKTFTGTVMINGSTVISTSTQNQYYIKRVDEVISIANSSLTVLYTIQKNNGQSWSLSISVAAGIAGIKIKNALPWDPATSRLGTSALPFHDIRSNNGTIGALAASSFSLGSDYNDGACGWTKLPNGLGIAWGEAPLTKGGTDTIYFNTVISRFPGFSNIPGITVGYETTNRSDPLVIEEYDKAYFKVSNQAGSSGSQTIWATFIAVGRMN